MDRKMTVRKGLLFVAGYREKIDQAIGEIDYFKELCLSSSV